MPPPWRQVWVEIYSAERGYEGRWVGDPSPDRGVFDEADRRRWVGEWGNWIRPETVVRYLEDGDILVIGIFTGVEPPAYPRCGIPYVPPPE
jgi:hypothetical protein